MSERVGKTRSGQKNRLVAMDITAIKHERSTRPDTTGTGAAQRMTAWGMPAEAGGEEDGFANAVPGKRDAQHVTRRDTSGRLFVCSSSRLRTLIARGFFGQFAKFLGIAQLDVRRYAATFPVVHALLNPACGRQAQRFSEGLVRPCRGNQSGDLLSIHTPILNTAFIFTQGIATVRVTTLCLIR